MFDSIIVGAGFAGSSCALWLKQLGYTPVLIDKQIQCGGLQLSNPYTNTWIASSFNVQGKDVANAMHENMTQHQVTMLLGQEALESAFIKGGVNVDLADGSCIAGKFLVLAGGVIHKTGGFINQVGITVGSGSSVENINFSGARVAILGGGDSAFENYLIAKDRGATSVVIFARSLKARASMLDKVSPDDVVVGEYDVDSGTHSVNGVPFDQILVLYGYEASKKSLLGIDLTMRPDGFVSTNEDCLTSHPLVYAIGEITRRSHPCCITSMADGVVAAKAIQRRLEVMATIRYAGLTRKAASLGSKVSA